MEFPLPFSADLKKKKTKPNPFIDYSASFQSVAVASGGHGIVLAEGMTHEPCLVCRSPRLLCFSPFLPAACADELVDAKSDGAEVAAALVAGGRGEEGRREVSCPLQAAGMGKEIFTGVSG